MVYTIHMPHITVIIPTYNRKALLREAVESVLGQTFTDFELIVVDDGSTDGTAAMITDIRDPRLRCVQQANRGVSAARNHGIRLAHGEPRKRGEWIAFLDSDDYWLPTKLERQLAFAAAHPEYLIHQTEETWIRNGRRANPMKKHAKSGGMIYEQCLPLCIISPSAVMIKRTLFDDVGLFDETLPACEDYDLWLRISCRYPVGLLPEQLIIKRGGHDDQLSRTPTLDKYRIEALRKILASGVLTQSQTAVTLKELAHKCRVYGNGCLKRGKVVEGEQYLNVRHIPSGARR